MLIHSLSKWMLLPPSVTLVTTMILVHPLNQTMTAQLDQLKVIANMRYEHLHKMHGRERIATHNDRIDINRACIMNI